MKLNVIKQMFGCPKLPSPQKVNKEKRLSLVSEGNYSKATTYKDILKRIEKKT